MILEINFYSKLSKNICKIHSIYLEQLFITIFVSLFNKENKKLSVIYPTITSLCLWGALSFKGGVRTTQNAVSLEDQEVATSTLRNDYLKP